MRKINPTNKMMSMLLLAKRQALQSTARYHHGAVLVRGGSIVNVSHNSVDYSSFARRFLVEKKYATQHAEIKLVLGIDKSVTYGATAYIARVNNFGEFRYSKPCSTCIQTLKFCGVKKIIYTTNDGKVIRERI